MDFDQIQIPIARLLPNYERVLDVVTYICCFRVSISFGMRKQCAAYNASQCYR